MTQPKQQTRAASRGALPLLIGIVVAIALVLLTQQALAAQLGGFVAGIWVSVMGAVLSLVGAVFGG